MKHITSSVTASGSARSAPCRARWRDEVSQARRHHSPRGNGVLRGRVYPVHIGELTEGEPGRRTGIRWKRIER